MICSTHSTTEIYRRAIGAGARRARKGRERSSLRVKSTLLLLAFVIGLFGMPLHAQFCAPINAPAKPGISATLAHNAHTYQTAVQAAGVRMTNPANRLVADFTSNGVNLVAGSAQAEIAFSAYGYGEKLHAARPAAPNVQGNRLEYARGALSEWYVNGPFGLEQGFTIPLRPGKSQGKPLALAFTIRGDLVAVLDADAHGLTLENNHVPVLRYQDLKVTDATGRELRAWMEVHRNRLLIRVKDAGARYPLTIDPFFQAAELTSCVGNVGDRMGWSVATNGNGSMVVAGAPDAMGACTTYFCLHGAAYVFLKNFRWGWGGPTPNIAAAELLSSDAADGDDFGWSLSASSDGNTIVVAAPFAAVGGNSQQGAIYVFVKPSTGWSTAPRSPLYETAKLTASDGTASASFGYSVGISADGSTIVATAVGAAYVFQKPAGGWASSNETAKLTSSDAGPYMGSSVAIDTAGDTIAVGAAQSAGTVGAAYVFAQTAGAWVSNTENAKLTASDGQNNDRLGIAVALSGDGSTVVAGADATVGFNSEQGAAYVFERQPSGWSSETEAAKFTASDGQLQDGLGWSLGLSSDCATLAASAPYANIGANVAQGAVYVYAKPAGGWSTSTETLKFTIANGEGAGWFAYSVAVDNTGVNIVAGEPFPTVNANGAGAMYVFGGSAAAPKATVSPAQLSITSLVGVSSAPQSVTLTNTGTAPLTVTSVAVSPCDINGCVQPFTATQNCVAASPLAPGAHCSESVVFTPTATGIFSASLFFTDDSAAEPGSTQASLLVGTATQATPSTAIRSLSSNPAMVDQNVTVTFSVTPPSGETLTPSGTVTVLAVPSNASCAATLPANSCTLAFSSTSSQQISASYRGDSNFSGSVSPAVSETVSKATTSTVLFSTANPSIAGQAVTFTTTVLGIYGGTPSGSVTFKQGGAALATVALVNGQASYTTTFTTSGTRSTTATYSGDGNYVASTSAVLSQLVKAAPATVTLSSSLNPSTYGQSIRLTVTVKPNSGTGVPTGTATFKRGATILANVGLTNGTAAYVTGALNAGTNSITAMYSGDSTYATSTSVPLSQVVKKATTKTVVTSSLNPSRAGQSVTFTATVSPQYSGALTGNVTFKHGSTTLATVAMSGGKARFTTTTLPTGSDAITAAYGGSANFTGSSASLTQTVNP